MAKRKTAGQAMKRRLRNAGPNADSAADLLGDAKRMLEDCAALCHNPSGVDPMAIAKGIANVIALLGELETVETTNGEQVNRALDRVVNEK